MAEKEITYKIRIDDSNLSEQLSNIRSQIDAAVTNQPFVANPFPFDRTNFNIAPLPQSLPIPIGETASSIYQRAQMQVAELQQTLTNSTAFASNSFGAIQSTAMNVGDRLGIGSTGFVNPIGFTGDEGWLQTSLASRFGVGYDPRMSLSVGDYQKTHNQRLPLQLPEFTGSVVGGAIGLLGGFSRFGLMGGFLAGGLASYAGEKALGWGIQGIYGQHLQDIQTSMYVNQTMIDRGMLGAGLFSPGELIANSMSSNLGTVRASLQNLNRRESEELLKGFTDLGGFDNARSADDYVKRFEDMLIGHRSVMHALRVTSEKALQVMAELEKSNLIGNATGQFSSYADAAQIMTGIGASVGIGGLSLISNGLQIQQQLLQTMPGISTTGAFLTGVDAVTNVRSLARSGGFDSEFIARVGGLDQLTSTLLNSAQQYGHSPLGRLNLLQGAGSRSPIDAISGGINMLRSPEDMFRFAMGVDLGNQFEQAGAINTNLMAVQQAIGTMGMMGGVFSRDSSGRYDPRTVIGMIMRQQGVDRNTAEAMLRLGQLAPRTQQEQYETNFNNVLGQKINEMPTDMQALRAEVDTAIGNFVSDMKPGFGGALIGGTLGGAAALIGGVALAPALAIGTAVGALAGGAYYLYKGRDGMSRDYNDVTRYFQRMLSDPRRIQAGVLGAYNRMDNETQSRLRTRAARESSDIEFMLDENTVQSKNGKFLREGYFGIGFKYTPIDVAVSRELQSRQDSVVEALASDIEALPLELRETYAGGKGKSISDYRMVAEEFLTGGRAKSIFERSLKSRNSERVQSQLESYVAYGLPNVISAENTSLNSTIAQLGLFDKYQGPPGEKAIKLAHDIQTGALKSNDELTQTFIKTVRGTSEKQTLDKIHDLMLITSADSKSELTLEQTLSSYQNIQQMSKIIAHPGMLNFVKQNIAYDKLGSTVSKDESAYLDALTAQDQTLTNQRLLTHSRNMDGYLKRISEKYLADGS